MRAAARGAVNRPPGRPRIGPYSSRSASENAGGTWSGVGETAIGSGTTGRSFAVVVAPAAPPWAAGGDAGAGRRSRQPVGCSAERAGAQRGAALGQAAVGL